jgi:hypothetical protein
MERLHPKQSLRLASIAILVVGLAAAFCIYLFADDPATDPSGSQVVIVEGSSYSVPLSSNKLYVRDVQRFGGKAALLFDDLNRWFAGRWQGRALAETIFWISLFASLAVFLIARYLYPDEPRKSDE